MNVPETLEQYLIQFLNENKNKDYPDNYNDIVDAAQIITDHYFSQQAELDEKDSYIAELEDECDNMRYCGQDIVDDIRTNIKILKMNLKHCVQTVFQNQYRTLLKTWETFVTDGVIKRR